MVWGLVQVDGVWGFPGRGAGQSLISGCTLWLKVCVWGLVWVQIEGQEEDICMYVYVYIYKMYMLFIYILYCYIYIYTHIYIHTHTHTHIYIYIYIYIYIHK